MSKQCNHEWRMWKDAGTMCVKCNMNAINLIADLQAQLAAKERQLEAASRDIDGRSDCPAEVFEEDFPWCEDCQCIANYEKCWRRRWEEAGK